MSGRTGCFLVVDGSRRDLTVLLEVGGLLAARTGAPLRVAQLHRGAPEGSLDAAANLACRRDVLVSILSASAAGEKWARSVLAFARAVPKPVLVVPSPLTGWAGPRRVLVPLDDSADRAAAAEAALGSLGVRGTAVTLVQVLDATGVPRYWDNPHYEYQARTRELEARFGAAVRKAVLVRGDDVAGALDVILRVGDFDMIAIAWSQRIEAGRAGVTRAILASSPVPLLLVPIAGAARHGHEPARSRAPAA